MLQNLSLAPGLSLLGAATAGFAGIALDLLIERLLKPRRMLGSLLALFVEASLQLLCMGAGALLLVLLPHQSDELGSMAIAWAAGTLVSLATLDRKRWRGTQ